MFWFLAAHAALGALVFVWREPAGMMHFWATAAFGTWITMSAKRPFDLAVLAAYIVGAEVLWRMSGAAVFWEGGKYAVAAVLLVGLVRFPRVRPIAGPIAYFAFLAPAIILSAQAAVDFSVLRQQISFNLSGPLSLAVAACFFRQVTLSRAELSGMLLAVMGPVVSIAALTVFSTYAASRLVFFDASNFATSGGFGPNQVSGILSLGTVLSFLVLATTADLGIRRRGILFAILAVCAVQSAMTFSRGGVYMAAIAIVGASVLLLRDRSSRSVVVGTVVASVLLFALVAPRLESQTEGALAARFQDPNMTNRGDLMQNDLRLWAENPAFGTGVGRGSQGRAVRRYASGAAHTEWTRMLAEHGTLGFVSILLLLVMMAGNVRRGPGPLERAVVVSLVLWGSSFLFVNAMRITAPGFLIGLTCASLALSPHGRSPLVRWRRRPAHAGSQ